MEIKSKKIFALFQKYQNKKFVFIQPKGNWGDLLILKGLEKLAKYANLNYEIISCEAFIGKTYSTDHILYILGNGAFNNIWGAGPVQSFAQAIATHTGVVVLGPSTIFIDDNFIKKSIMEPFKKLTAQKVYIFCRGTITFQNISNLKLSNCEVQLEHDTAFNMQKIDFAPCNIEVKSTLYAIRKDKESIKFEKFQPLILWLDPIEESKSFEEWVSIHNGIQEIVTNRMHSAILGVILCKKVTLLPNIYHKNKGLWEFSLKELGVNWKDEIESTWLYSQLIKNKLYRKFSNSYKIQQIVNAPYLKKVLSTSIN